MQRVLLQGDAPLLLASASRPVFHRSQNHIMTASPGVERCMSGLSASTSSPQPAAANSRATLVHALAEPPVVGTSVPTTVTVGLGDRSYPIYIGGHLLDQGDLLASHVTGTTVLIVSNTTVAPLYLQRCRPSMPWLGGVAGSRDYLFYCWDVVLDHEAFAFAWFDVLPCSQVHGGPPAGQAWVEDRASYLA